MNLRDRIVAVLTVATIAAAFAGSWLQWGFAIALLVAAGVMGITAVLIAQSPVDEFEDEPDEPEPEILEGDRQAKANVVVRNPFFSSAQREAVGQ